jgi:hypothetical protein
MKTLILITVTEGGADRKDYSEKDIAAMKIEKANNSAKARKEGFDDCGEDCDCLSCKIIRLFDNSKIGEELVIKEPWNTWGFVVDSSL